MPSTKLERRITISGLMIACGLLIQTISHFWAHPLAFMTFLVVGAPLVALGIVMFLLALIGDRT
jgi:hypothetical protein